MIEFAVGADVTPEFKKAVADLAGGKLPSGLFGVNAAWWAIMLLAYNLNSAMKRLVLGGEWVYKRMKAIQFALINLPGRIIRSSRELILRLTNGHTSNELLLLMRRRILGLSHDSFENPNEANFVFPDYSLWILVFHLH